MQLNEDQLKVKKRGEFAKAFLESDFYKDHFFPALKTELSKDLPAPVGKEWQDAYRNMYATSQATEKVLNILKTWAAEYEHFRQLEQTEEKDFMDA